MSGPAMLRLPGVGVALVKSVRSMIKTHKNVERSPLLLPVVAR